MNAESQLALVFVEHPAQVAGDGQLLVGLLLLGDHLLEPLVDPAHLDQRVLVLAQLRVVERLEHGDHQLLEVLAAVGALALVGEQRPGLLADGDDVQLAARARPPRRAPGCSPATARRRGAPCPGPAAPAAGPISRAVASPLSSTSRARRSWLVRLVRAAATPRVPRHVVASRTPDDSAQRATRRRVMERSECARDALPAHALLLELLADLLLVRPLDDGRSAGCGAWRSSCNRRACRCRPAG